LYYYKDNLWDLYNYSINRIDEKNTIYYNCADSKYQGIATLRLQPDKNEKFKEDNSIIEFS
jgi:hypothetical protein